MSYVALGAVSSNQQPLLKKGSKGPAVASAQAFLNSWRASVGKPTLSVNSVFDASMEAAVKDFQKSFKIGVDGKIGPETWYTLLNRKKPSSKSRQTDLNIPFDFSPPASSRPAWIFPAIGAGAALLLFAVTKKK